ncbi:MAG: intradiol ring-cleavage dioxygenase [Sphingomonadaceae bacterium]|nr:intradiol ring-cleavage dioxygenase [Sphingomonadaceae bacterium]
MSSIDDHDHGLVHDLEIIGRRIERRRALAWLAGTGAAFALAGCGGGANESASSSSTSGTTTTTTASSGSTSTSSGSTSGSTSSGASCIADPSETAGPYPADGTNTSSGATSNVLTASGIVRSDIRSSFISSTTTAPGVQVTLTLTLVNASDGCTPLAGYAIYFWQCDRSGNYSLYGAPSESYLRGVQVTDGNGQVTFVTIFPACYSGRYPHQHFEIYESLSAASAGRNAVLTSQLAMPAAICSAVYNDASGYSESVTNFARVSLDTDLVFGDNSAAQLAQQTPAMTGSVDAGYVATNAIAVAA